MDVVRKEVARKETMVKILSGLRKPTLLANEVSTALRCSRRQARSFGLMALALFPEKYVL